jgi:hypothetical protein
MSGTNGALQLIEMASARLCQAMHESVGQLEQALSTQANDDASKSAAAKAAQALFHRLKLIRAAWGPADEPITLVIMTGLARGLPERVVIDTSALPPATVFCASRGRILLNLLLLAADSLPAGGRIVLAGAADDIFLQLVGREAAWPVGMSIYLTDEAEALTALTNGQNPQMALTSLFAQAAKIRLSLLLAPTAQMQPAIVRLGGAN